MKRNRNTAIHYVCPSTVQISARGSPGDCFLCAQTTLKAEKRTRWTMKRTVRNVQYIAFKVLYVQRKCFYYLTDRGFIFNLLTNISYPKYIYCFKWQNNKTIIKVDDYCQDLTHESLKVNMYRNSSNYFEEREFKLFNNNNHEHPYIPGSKKKL